MKKLAVFLLSFLFLLSMVHGQTVHPVDTSPNALYNVILAAGDGDTLELTESGEYHIDSLIYINKKLTIRAAESLTSRPVLRNYHPTASPRFIFEIITGGHLSLEGLDLDGMAGSAYPAENLIQTAEKIEGSYSLYVENCYLRDVNMGGKGSFFRGYGLTYADTVKFTNSVLHNCGKIGIRINETDNDINYFEFSNSSMFDVWNEGIYVQGSDVKFRVNHCTFNNIGYGTADILRPRFILDAEIKNSIFSNVPEPRTRSMLLYGASLLDYCAFYEVGEIVIHDQSAFTMGENILHDVDPQYFNAEYKDFSLLETSPLLTYAEDGGVLGDPNWPNNRPFIPAVLEVGSADNAIYDSLQSARSGDILELTDAGDYLLDSLLFVDKEITIRAAAGLESKPVLKNVNPDLSTRFIFEIETGGELTLLGLDLDGGAGGDTPAKYLIKTASSIDGSYKLKVDNCILHDVVSGSDGNFFRAYGDTYADSVIFTDCILYNSGKEGIRIKDDDNTVKYFGITNSTMYNTVAEGIYVQGNEVVFRVDHCTFNNLGSNHYEMIRPRYILDADIRNSIFSNTPEPHSTTMEIYGASVIDYCDFYNVGKVSIDDTTLFEMGANVLFDVDPEYGDTSSADFSLLETSPLYHIADDRTALGDPRWAVNTPPLPSRVIPVGLDRNAIYDSLIIASSGDILELTESGEYLLDSLVHIDKSITIRAAEGLETKPVIKFVNPEISTRHIFEIVTGGNLNLIGLDLDGLADSDTPAKYILKTASSVEGSYQLIVEDCILHDVVQGTMGNFFRAYNDTYADTVIFRDCILYNSGKEGIRIKDADNTVKYFEMSQTTMYNTATEGIYIQGNEVVFRINHCTFNNLGINHAEMVRPRYVIDVDIRNSIFSNTPEPHSRTILLYGPSTIAYCDFYNVGQVKPHDSAAANLGPLYEVDPRYEDVANNNFTLIWNSPLYGIADDGEALGDLRWATNQPAVSIESIEIEEGLPGSFDLGQNFPNPFNNSTLIPINIPTSGEYTLKVYNMAGEEVATLFDKKLGPGSYTVNFSATNVTSGIYFYNFRGDNINLIRKMIFLK